MSVHQEFIDIFIPIATIEAKFLGGWHGFIQRYPEVYAAGWHDWHLFRQGAMNPHQIDALIDWWRHQGFTPYKLAEGAPKRWVDLCVSSWGKPTLPCSWIAYDAETGGAFLKGTEPGDLIGPEQMPCADVEQIPGYLLRGAF